MSAPAHVTRLRSLVERCTPRLSGIDEAAARTRRPGGKWSPSEVLGHLIDSASNNHVRFVEAQLRDALVFPGYDQEAWVDAQRYRDASWPELVSLWRGLNLRLASVMEAVPDDARLSERSEHNLDEIAWRTVPRDRSTTLDYFMADYVGHVEHHLKQVLGPDLGGVGRLPHSSAPALLVVDVQEDAVARRPYGVDEVITNIAELLTVWRESGGHVVFVQHDGKPGEPEEPNTPGWEIHAGVAPLPDEPVFRKRFNSAFRGTNLHEHLRERGVAALVIVGIQTEYCVDTTVRVAFELGYSIVIPEMTNTTYDNGDVPARAIHEMINARVWDRRFASVVPMPDVLRLGRGVV